MEMPNRNETFEDVAARIIDKLDDADYSREEVIQIAIWVQYLSTQE